MKTVLLTIALFLSASLSASVAAADGVTLKGKIKASGGELLAQAVVKVFIEGAAVDSISSADGSFLLSNLAQESKADIVVLAEGYQPMRISVATGDSDIDLGVLELHKLAIELDEVVVHADPVKIGVDKTTLHPTATEVERSTNMINFLSQLAFRVPDMQINQTLQTVTVNGAEPTIVINGRKRDLNALRALLPSDVLRVEYSNAPDPRWGSNGINVVTRPIERGGSVMAQATTALTTVRENHQVAATYRIGKNEFSLNYFGLFHDRKKEYQSSEAHYIGGGKDIVMKAIGLPSQTIDRQHQITMDYAHVPSANKLFTATAYMDIHSQNSNVKQDVTEATRTYKLHQTNVYDYIDPSLTLYWSQTLGKGTFEASATAAMTHLNSDRGMDYSTGYNSNSFTRNNSYGLTGQLSYRRTYSKFTTTYSGWFVHSDAYSAFYVNSNTKQPQKQKSDMGALNASINGNLWTLDYFLQAGIEFSHIDKVYWRPSVYAQLQRQLPAGLTAMVSFNVTSSPAGLSQESNVLLPVNELLWQTGTSNLKPSVWKSIYGRLSWYRGKFYATASVANSRASNPIVALYEYVDSPDSPIVGKFLRTQQNARFSSKLSGNLSMGVSNLFNFLSVSLFGGWQRGVIEAQGYRAEKCSWSLQGSLGAYWRNWQIFVQFMPVRPDMLSGTQIYRQIGFNSVTLSYNWNQWSFSAKLDYPFSPHGFHQRSWELSNVRPESRDYYIKDQQNMVSLSVTYSTSFGRSLNKPQKGLGRGRVDSGINLSY